LTEEVALDGEWRVERLSGLLPAAGVRKSIQGNRGVTTLAFARFPFAVIGTRLIYRHLPVHDELIPISERIWRGTGHVIGVGFCTFRLVKEPC
jgi:hypothetical protein